MLFFRVFPHSLAVLQAQADTHNSHFYSPGALQPMKPTARALAAISFAALAATASFTVHAQYQWIDGNGRRVFSDQPPPPGTPQKNILKQPSADAVRNPAPAPAAAPASASAPDAQAAGPSDGQDPALQEQMKKKEAEQAAQKKAEQEKLAIKAENCRRAISTKATLESGRRLRQPDGKGGMTYMDGPQRADEMRKINEIIRSECN